MNIIEERKYNITGEKDNILTKIGTDVKWMYAINKYQLEKNKEYKWKIKILKTEYKNILIGVAPIDFDINYSTHKDCGWYLHCYDSTLYSGPPHNYNDKKSNLKFVEDEEITVIMDMNKRTLKFIINNEDKGESYSDIPIDKPLIPIVGLYNINDSIEISDFQ